MKILGEKISAFAAIGSAGLSTLLAVKYGLTDMDLVQLKTLVIANGVVGYGLNWWINSADEVGLYRRDEDAELASKYGSSTVVVKQFLEGQVLLPKLALLGPGLIIDGAVNGVKNLAIEAMTSLREKFSNLDKKDISKKIDV